MQRLVVLALLAACAGGSSPPTAAPVADPRVSVADAAVSTERAPPPPDAAPAPPPDPRAERIELTFMGDVMFGGLFKSGKFSPQDVPRHDPFEKVAALFASDLPIANLETTVMDEIPPLDGQKRFVATPDQVAVMPKNGLTAVTIANNHIGDTGREGIEQTLRHLEALGLTVFGAPRSEEPLFRADSVEVKGWKVAVVAATARLNRRPGKGGPRVPYLHDEKLPPALLPVIEAARPDHDLVLVIVHWGHEYEDAPARWQVEAAHAMVDAGADVVVGHHPHVLQGIERYKGRVIAYSLGNFVFQNATEPERWTGVLRLSFARDVRCPDAVVFHPTDMQRSPIYHPVPASGRALDRAAERLTKLSAARPLSTPWELAGDRLVIPVAVTDCPVP